MRDERKIGCLRAIAGAGLIVLAAHSASAQEFIPLRGSDLEALNREDSILGFLGAVETISFATLTPGDQSSRGRRGEGFETFRQWTDEARSIVDGLPIPSGSTSFAYAFDPALETFVRSEQPLSPALSQNARTNGTGVLTIGVSFSYLEFEEFEGFESSTVLFSAGAIEPGEVAGVDFRAQNILLYDFELEENVFGISFQYGVTENFDVGVYIPVIDLQYRGRAVDAFFFENPDTGGLFVGLPDGEVIEVSNFQDIPRAAFDPSLGASFRPGVQYDRDESGIGDVLLRGKYFMGSIGDIGIGGLLDVALPSGDEENLLGVGTVRFDPRLILSRADSILGVHLNLGYHADVEERSRDRVDYSVGAEVRMTRWLTFLVDHIGRIRPHEGNTKKFEMVPGVKLNPYKDLVVGFNGIIPLNDEGLTTEFTPNAIVEGSFTF